MTEREKILARVREALAVPTLHHASAPEPPRPATGQARQWLPLVGDAFEERLANFHRNATTLRAAFHCLNSAEELGKLLREMAGAEGWKKIATHRGELTDRATAELGMPVLQTDVAYDVNELDQCDAGITECDALVAQTGSVLVTNRSAGGRALSVLPPHHVVLARRRQLLRDLPEAFEWLQQKYGANYPSMISFITGPSRTADIERILVLGAHGPRKLTILCW
jgi:L-lactate dehydrogenase complex protein LldG